MKKSSLIVISILALSLIFSACSGPKGIIVKRAKNGLEVQNLQNIQGYDANNNKGKILMTDSLYTDGPPDDSKVTVVKPRKDNTFILPMDEDGTIKLPKYIFQLKNNVFSKEDYLWAAGITPDYKLQTILLDNTVKSPKRSAKNKVQKGPDDMDDLRTFNIYGSEIKAVKANDGSTVFYDPYKLSFMLNESEAVDKLVQFSYNGLDMQIFDLTDPDVAKPVNRNVKVVMVDLEYGSRFTFISENGSYPNMSPQMIKDGRLKLLGVKLSRNQFGNEPPYMFEIMNIDVKSTSSVELPKTDTNKDCAGNECEGYYKLRLKPLRYANTENYRTNGYVSVPCCEIYKNCQFFLLELISLGAVGRDEATGRNQVNVVLDPMMLASKCPTLYDRYKDRIKYP